MNTNLQQDFIKKIQDISLSRLSEVEIIRAKQKRASARLEALGFPHRKLEDWKYYDFDQVLTSDYFESVNPDTDYKSDLSEDLIKKNVFAECSDNVIVTINGNYNSSLSKTKFDASELEIINFNNPTELKPKQLEILSEYFAKNLEQETDFFKLSNTALMKSGFMLDIKANFTSKKSLQIIHITNQHSFNQTRSLINVGKNSEIELIVSYIGINDSKFLSNACIEINQEANSKLKLTKIQNNTQSGNLLYNLKSDLAKDASFYYNSFNLKAKSSREAIAVNLNESNAECTINGIYLLDDKNKSHHLIKVNHLAPFTYSKQLFKGLLYSEAKAEFNGGVFVAPGADGTNAEQLNQNLLLSERAHVDTRPTLDIYADDVKCNHGATIGELDASEIFYLMSRGISKDKALALLTLSFCEEVFENINLDSVKTFIRKEALAKVDESFKSHLQQKGSPFKA